MEREPTDPNEVNEQETFLNTQHLPLSVTQLCHLWRLPS